MFVYGIFRATAAVIINSGFCVKTVILKSFSVLSFWCHSQELHEDGVDTRRNMSEM